MTVGRGLGALAGSWGRGGVGAVVAGVVGLRGVGVGWWRGVWRVSRGAGGGCGWGWWRGVGWGVWALVRASCCVVMALVLNGADMAIVMSASTAALPTSVYVVARFLVQNTRMVEVKLCRMSCGAAVNVGALFTLCMNAIWQVNGQFQVLGAIFELEPGGGLVLTFAGGLRLRDVRDAYVIALAAAIEGTEDEFVEVESALGHMMAVFPQGMVNVIAVELFVMMSVVEKVG